MICLASCPPLSKNVFCWSLKRRYWHHWPLVLSWQSSGLPHGVYTASPWFRQCKHGSYHCQSKFQSVERQRVDAETKSSSLIIKHNSCCSRYLSVQMCSLCFITWKGSSIPRGKLLHLSSCPQWLAMYELQMISDSVKRGLKWKAILSSRSHRKLISNLENREKPICNNELIILAKTEPETTAWRAIIALRWGTCIWAFLHHSSTSEC